VNRRSSWSRALRSSAYSVLARLAAIEELAPVALGDFDVELPRGTLDPCPGPVSFGVAHIFDLVRTLKCGRASPLFAVHGVGERRVIQPMKAH
jgi:hypothetical protein